MDKEYSNAKKLAGFIIFNVPSGQRKHSWDGSYYFTEVCICGICGDIINERGSKEGVKKHLIENHPEWEAACIILGWHDHKIGNKAKKLALKLLINDTALVGGQCRISGEYNWYFCLLCGKPLYKKNFLTHIESDHIGWINAFWFVEKEEEKEEDRVRKLGTYPLKPWRDPESLFCSKNLKNIIGKEPLSGNECGD
jgi:hypothetical protein